MPIIQYIVFKIEDREFAIEIANVKTIEKITEITRVPGAREHIKGVINLRGEVIPVFDTRERIGLEERDYDDESRIIIVNIGDIEIGITADTAKEVIDIEDGLIDANTEFAGNREDNYIKDIIRLRERIIAVMDLEKLLKIE